MVTDQNPRKRAKNVFTPDKIFQDREIMQNYIFDMLLLYNNVMI